MKEHLRREVKPQNKEELIEGKFSLFGKLLTVQNVADTLRVESFA